MGPEGKYSKLDNYPHFGDAPYVTYVPPEVAAGWTLREQPEFFRHTAAPHVEALERSDLGLFCSADLLEIFPTDMTEGNVFAYDDGEVVFDASPTSQSSSERQAAFFEAFGFDPDSIGDYYWRAALQVPVDAKVEESVAVIPVHFELRQYTYGGKGTNRRSVEIKFQTSRTLHRSEHEFPATESILVQQSSQIGGYRASKKWYVHEVTGISSPTFSDMRRIVGPHPVREGMLQRIEVGYRVRSIYPDAAPYAGIINAAQCAISRVGRDVKPVLERGCGNYHDLRNLRSIPNGAYYLVESLPPDVEAMKVFLDQVNRRGE